MIMLYILHDEIATKEINLSPCWSQLKPLIANINQLHKIFLDFYVHMENFIGHSGYMVNVLHASNNCIPLSYINSTTNSCSLEWCFTIKWKLSSH